MKDLSHANTMAITIYSLASNFKQVSSDQFYVPSEVNGKWGINVLTGEKIDAHKALYEYQAPSHAIIENDPYSILN